MRITPSNLKQQNRADRKNQITDYDSDDFPYHKSSF